jgi:hypothetical protein
VAKQTPSAEGVKKTGDLIIGDMMRRLGVEVVEPPAKYAARHPAAPYRRSVPVTTISIPGSRISSRQAARVKHSRLGAVSLGRRGRIGSTWQSAS